MTEKSLDAAQRFIDVASRFWHPVARSADLSAGELMGVRLLNQRLALWRDRAGAAHAIGDDCPHRGTRLSLGEITAGGCVRCPYHGWLFDPNGACTRIPQLGRGVSIPRQADAPSYRVSEHAGLVWTCLVDSEAELRPRPTWEVAERGTHWLHVGDVYEWEAQAFRQLENFCDVGHFSILHADTFGDPSLEEVGPLAVKVHDGGWRISFDFPYGNIRFEYRLELPFTVALAGASGPGTVLCMASSPVSATATRVFWMCAFPDGTRIDRGEYEAFEARIWLPDRSIVESQQPRWLPLDLRQELHLPFDRLAVAYRRRLAEIGFPVIEVPARAARARAETLASSAPTS